MTTKGHLHRSKSANVVLSQAKLDTDSCPQSNKWLSVFARLKMLVWCKHDNSGIDDVGDVMDDDDSFKAGNCKIGGNSCSGYVIVANGHVSSVRHTTDAVDESGSTNQIKMSLLEPVQVPLSVSMINILLG